MSSTSNVALSYAFSAENDVKQGGILSPILFCVYIGELLNQVTPVYRG